MEIMKIIANYGRDHAGLNLSAKVQFESPSPINEHLRPLATPVILHV